jgi:hypothetical protein
MRLAVLGLVAGFVPAVAHAEAVAAPEPQPVLMGDDGTPPGIYFYGAA